MLKFLFAFLLLAHGLIHFMGFAKAFKFGDLPLLRETSITAGITWLITALLFMIAVVLFLLHKNSWPLVLLVAVLISQVLIILVWKEARAGTIFNIIALLAAVGELTTQNFEARFIHDVNANFARSNNSIGGLVTLKDIEHLPPPVRQYLLYTGVVGLPKLTNMRISFTGEMRDKGKPWFPFETVQYNFFEHPARLFFMKAMMRGIMVPGYHRYQDEKASMDIRLFGLVPVAQAKGVEMDKAETVTLFNDMCLFAPAALIDKRILWQGIDSTSTRAIFTNGQNKITATLHFNAAGQLINFISDDRYAIGLMQQYRFSTPVKDYKLIDGRSVPTFGEAIWHYPNGLFVYGKFYLKHIAYNASSYEEN